MIAKTNITAEILEQCQVLLEIAAYTPNWDTYDAAIITPHALGIAVQLLAQVVDWPPTQLAATPDGGVLVTWRWFRREIHVWINPHGNLESSRVDMGISMDMEGWYAYFPDGDLAQTLTNIRNYRTWLTGENEVA